MWWKRVLSAFDEYQNAHESAYLIFGVDKCDIYSKVIKQCFGCQNLCDSLNR